VEQKAANDKLGSKIREQSRVIVALQQERDQLLTQPAFYDVNAADVSGDRDKVRSLQQHAANQQTLLTQLRAKLEESEHHDRDVIEELQERLKANVDSVSRLNQQLNALQKELRRVKAELEREAVAAKSFRVQVEAKEQTIGCLKAQLEAKAFQVYFDEAPAQLMPEVDAARLKQEVEKALRDTGMTNPSQLDKSYWIEKVSQLAGQLQESSEYWSEKLRSPR